MNTHNVNTATIKSSKTWSEQINTKGLPALLTADLVHLASLCDKKVRMHQEDRFELIFGFAHNIADKI